MIASSGHFADSHCCLCAIICQRFARSWLPRSNRAETPCTIAIVPERGVAKAAANNPCRFLPDRHDNQRGVNAEHFVAVGRTDRGV